MKRLLAAAAVVGIVGWGWVGFLEIASVQAAEPGRACALVSADDTLVPELDTPELGGSGEVDTKQQRVQSIPAGRDAHMKAENRNDDFLVNVNTADCATLDRLPGVGPAIAERIIAYRTEHGAMQSPDDLLNVKGIGEKTLDKMRTHLSF